MNNNSNRYEFETDDVKVQVTFEDYRDRPIKTRVYVDGETDVDFSEAYALQRANGYVAKGTDPVEDKLFAKLNRQVVKNKREVLEDACQSSEEVDDLLAGLGKLTFSRTAGCSCGCSPAFIGQVTGFKDGRRVRSIYISRKAK